MSVSLLSELLTDEFADAIGFVLPPAAMRIVFRRSVAVRKLTQAIRHSVVTEAEIRDFVASIVKSFKFGEGLTGDLALAAIAVAIERLPVDFVDEYLDALASLRLREMSTCIRIARECIKHRANLPKKEFRQQSYLRTRPGTLQQPKQLKIHLLFVGTKPKTLRSRSARLLKTVGSSFDKPDSLRLPTRPQSIRGYI